MTFKHSTGSMLAGWIATRPLISHKQASRAICPRPVCTTDLFFLILAADCAAYSPLQAPSYSSVPLRGPSLSNL